MELQNKASRKLSFSRRLFLFVLRTFFKLIYHQFAWTYDWVASLVSVGAWSSWVQSVLPFIKERKTLEIGFGPGHLQLSLARSGYRIFGLDESIQMARITQRRLNKREIYPNLVRGSAEELPFASESFNHIVMTFPAEFLNKQSMYSELKRVLTPGGSAIILPMAWLTGHRPIERAVAWLNRFTGEAPIWDEKYLEPLKNMGFDVTWQMIDFPSSKAVIFSLIKP